MNNIKYSENLTPPSVMENLEYLRHLDKIKIEKLYKKIKKLKNKAQRLKCIIDWNNIKGD